MRTQTDAKFDVRAGKGRPSQGANMKNIRHRFRPGGLHFLVLIIELFWSQGFYLPMGRSATFWSLQSVQSARFGISRTCAADLEAPTDRIGWFAGVSGVTDPSPVAVLCKVYSKCRLQSYLAV